MEILFKVVMILMAVFLIVLVLIQRGRGGGLVGALGGGGGQSAFGAKAGDVFTRVTVVAAGLWIVFCMIAVKWFAGPDESFGDAIGTTPAANSPLPGATGGGTGLTNETTGGGATETTDGVGVDPFTSSDTTTGDATETAAPSDSETDPATEQP